MPNIIYFLVINKYSNFTIQEKVLKNTIQHLYLQYSKDWSSD